MELLAIEEIIEIESIATDNFITHRFIYKSDDYDVVGYIVSPQDILEKKYPVLIYNRGGHLELGEISHINSFATNHRTTNINRLTDIASYGYIVLASNYRINDRFGGDDVNDVIKLIDISEKFSFAKQGGVYLFGESRGGIMTYIVNRTDSRIIASAVWASPTNLITLFSERTDMQEVFINLIGDSPNDEFYSEYKQRSAIFWADEIIAPILIAHGGGADWRVRTQHSIDMALELEKYNIAHKLIIYDTATHNMPDEFLVEIHDWFNRHLIN